METKFKLALAGLAGVLIGATSIATLSAQGVSPTKAAPGYLIAEVEVIDPEGYKTYQDATRPALAATGGRFLVRGGKTIALDGEPPKPEGRADMDSQIVEILGRNHLVSEVLRAGLEGSLPVRDRRIHLI